MNIQEKQYADVTVLTPMDANLDHEKVEAFNALLSAYARHCSGEDGKFVLDMEHISLITSSSLSVLATVHHQCKAQNGRFVLAAMQPTVREIYNITRFNTIIQAYDDVRSALAALSPAAANAFGTD